MAFTKITAAGIGSTETVTLDGLSVINNGSFGGNLTVGGVLTYEDVTNVDSVGLITARNGIVVGSGITLSKDGDIFATGITTVSGNVKVGTGITLSPDGDGFFTGVITATSYSGIDLSDVTGATGDFSIADKIVHTGDTNTAIRFPSADTITAETGGSERVRVASDGRITQITGDLVIDQSNNGYGGLRILDSTAGEYSINYIAGRNSGATAHVFSVGGRTQNSSPWANASQSECARISQRGISFNGDDAQANCLDDYEEGTFNPTMANSITLHSSSDTLSYVKVGKLVHVTGVLRINSGNSSSDISITNMPFATVNSAESSGNAIGAVSLYDLNMNSGYSQVLCVMNPNSTQLNVVLQTQSGSQQLGMDAADNGYIGVSICYRAA